jgi:cysteine synthase A
MDLHEGFAGTVGATPLIRLPRLSDQAGAEILGKAEFLNPSGSVKDRAALGILREAEESGALHPGGTVVEGTAGNTGIGLAHLCNARGYRCVIYIPETQTQEKIDLLRTLGAEVHPVPAVPFRDPNNFQKRAGRHAAETANAIWANQFDNPANRRIHYRSTGPEIWQQTGGELDAFVAATGTGGTLAGVAAYLKEQRTDIRTVLADPPGSALFHYVRHGELRPEGAGSITEGIGTSRITDNLQGAPVDDALMVTDRESVQYVYRLLREEGLFLGSSSGLNVAAAVRVARELGPGSRVVTILCDSGNRYRSRLFNADWLAERGLTPETA